MRTETVPLATDCFEHSGVLEARSGFPSDDSLHARQRTRGDHQILAFFGPSSNVSVIWAERASLNGFVVTPGPFAWIVAVPTAVIEQLLDVYFFAHRFGVNSVPVFGTF